MHVAIVEDDPEYSAFIAGLVTRAGYGHVIFPTGSGFLAELRRETFDLVMLDWNLPDGSGMDLLQSIRTTMPRGVAVIMLTSRSDKQDITEALKAGADDYIVKPESPDVITARIEAVLRRVQPGRTERFLSMDGYEFDQLTSTVTIEGAPVALSAKEFTLALLLFQNPNRAFSRNYLLETIWHSVPDLPTRTLDMHVSKIRTKLNLRPENGFRIVALSSFGYRMERFPASAAE